MDETELEQELGEAGDGADAVLGDEPDFESMMDEDFDDEDAFFDEETGDVDETVVEVAAGPEHPEQEVQQDDSTAAGEQQDVDAEALAFEALAGVPSSMAAMQLDDEQTGADAGTQPGSSEATDTAAAATHSDPPSPASSVVDSPTSAASEAATEPAPPLGAAEQATHTATPGIAGSDGEYVTQYSRVREQIKRGRGAQKSEPSQEMTELLDRSRQAWRDRPVSRLVAPVPRTLVILDQEAGGRDQGSDPGSQMCVGTEQASGDSGAGHTTEPPAAQASGAIWVAGQDGVDVMEAYRAQWAEPVTTGTPDVSEQIEQIALEQAAEQPAEQVEQSAQTTQSPETTQTAQSVQTPEVEMDRPEPETGSHPEPVGPGQVDLAAAYAALDPLEQELLCDELGLAPAGQVAEVRSKARRLVGRLRGQVADLQDQLAAEREQVQLLRARLVMATAGSAADTAAAGESDGGMTGEVTGPDDLPGRGDEMVGSGDAASSGGTENTGQTTASAGWSLAELQRSRRSASSAGGHDDHDGYGGN